MDVNMTETPNDPPPIACDLSVAAKHPAGFLAAVVTANGEELDAVKCWMVKRMQATHGRKSPIIGDELAEFEMFWAAKGEIGTPLWSIEMRRLVLLVIGYTEGVATGGALEGFVGSGKAHDNRVELQIERLFCTDGDSATDALAVMRRAYAGM